MQTNGSASLSRQFLRNKWIRLILIIDTIAIIAVISILIFNATKSAAINLNITPIDAKIQIDGRGEYYNGSYQIHPGEHEIQITHPSLTPKSITVNIESGYNATVSTFLSPSDNDFSFYELKDNYQSLQKLIEIASVSNNITTDHDTSAETFISNYIKNTSISDLLPLYQQVGSIETDFITPIFYTIINGQDVSYDCVKSFCLVISDTTGQNKTAALDLIRSKGYNPDNYEIIYTTDRILPQGVISE